MTPQELARATAGVLIERGWHRRSYGLASKGAGPHCMIGAMWFVRDCIAPDAETNKSYWILRSKLEEVVGMEPLRWNDRHAHSIEDVLTALEAAGMLSG